ncbi:MAG: hypothetical protein WBA74_27520 [Cyclobacteriaceae bacterium]
MDIANSHVTNLIEKIKLSQEIYDKLSSKVHFEPMREIFDALRQEKNEVMSVLERELGLSIEEHSVSFMGSLKANVEKFGIELDHLVIQNNYNEALSFAIKREREIIHAFNDVLQDDALESKEATVIADYKVRTENLLDEITERFKRGDFKQNELD